MKLTNPYRAILATAALVAASPQASADMDPVQGVVATATSIGVTPESLVIADLHGSAELCLVRIEAAHDARTQLSALQELSAEAAEILTIRAQQVLANEEDEGVHAMYEEAVAAFDAIEVQLESLRQELFDYVMQDLPPERVAALVTWKSARGYKVPAAFRAVQRSADDWKTLEVAVRSAGRSTRLGQPIPEQTAMLLEQVWSLPTVAVAQTRLEVHLAMTKAVFEQFDQL